MPESPTKKPSNTTYNKWMHYNYRYVLIIETTMQKTSHFMLKLAARMLNKFQYLMLL
jgi:hypothetical protein